MKLCKGTLLENYFKDQAKLFTFIAFEIKAISYSTHRGCVMCLLNFSAALHYNLLLLRACENGAIYVFFQNILSFMLRGEMIVI